MQAVTTIGLDIAKSVFQVHGVDAAGPIGCWGQKRKVWLRVRNQGALSVQLSNGPTRRARAARQLVGTRLTSFASLTIAATSSR